VDFQQPFGRLADVNRVAELHWLRFGFSEGRKKGGRNQNQKYDNAVHRKICLTARRVPSDVRNARLKGVEQIRTRSTLAGAAKVAGGDLSSEGKPKRGNKSKSGTPCAKPADAESSSSLRMAHLESELGS
jgi:hypothetical protein